ncbi:hypothetical protein VIBNISO65_680055 [Vibrio nigripulchritudo SO65]|nr:hypothetical protein VIBNIAM115_1530055 [Vibrio nigripulchritudo AM115]CCN40567.1 hypothetical protein VIBNIFTn2_1340029 [Vibrio nigripulchritudo FTn2]CCN66140.1 hypothetical protein VIBNIPon4_50056 [Vibrio nigripulchritudo POn4]CCN78630.1 hypothetical protein VIBNISO65_680055 [Vibrio nigripulchritudo SO65]
MAIGSRPSMNLSLSDAMADSLLFSSELVFHSLYRKKIKHTIVVPMITAVTGSLNKFKIN